MDSLRYTPSYLKAGEDTRSIIKSVQTSQGRGLIRVDAEMPAHSDFVHRDPNWLKAESRIRDISHPGR